MKLIFHFIHSFLKIKIKRKLIFHSINSFLKIKINETFISLALFLTYFLNRK